MYSQYKNLQISMDSRGHKNNDECIVFGQIWKVNAKALDRKILTLKLNMLETDYYAYTSSRNQVPSIH